MIGVGETKQEFCILNRLVRFDERSGTIFYEPDPRHAEILLKDLNMETCKPVKSPNEKLTAEALAKRMELDVVDPHRISQYRSLTMRAAFLAQDRPDLSETVKCLARKMQGPTEADFGDLKRGNNAHGAKVHSAKAQRCRFSSRRLRFCRMSPDSQEYNGPGTLLWATLTSPLE